MRKSICLLVVCMMLLLNTVAFAEEMPWVSVKDGIEMSKISYDNLEGGEAVENTLLTITMSAKASEESDVPYAFVAVLYDADVMIGLDSDTKPIGTESTSFKAELNLPDDVSACRIAVALLKKTQDGFVPISKASYCPADSKFSKLVKVTADGEELVFDNEFNTAVFMTPTTTDFPEVFEVQTADAATSVDLTIPDAFPGDVVAVATLPDGTEITYTMSFFAGKHAVANALKDGDFEDADEDSYFKNNKISKEDLLSSAMDGGKENNISYDADYEDFYLKAFTNLSGVDEENGNYFGSRWVTDYDSHQVHSINYVHPELEGYDYFITKNGEVEKDTGLTYFEFDISYDSEIIIVAYNKCKSYPSDGWTESYLGDGFIRTSSLDYDNSKLIEDIGYDVTYNEAKAWDAKVDDMAYFSILSGGNAEYEKACESLAASISERHGRLVTKEDLYGLYGKLVGDEYAYSYTYSKVFEIPEGEETKTVKIYGPDTNQKRGFVVVVKPLTAENAEEATEPALKAIEIDGMAIDGFKADEYVYSYEIDPRDGTLPEIVGIGAGEGLEITTTYTIADDGKSAEAVITVAKGSNEVTYTVDLTLDEYVPNFASEDYNIVDIGAATYKEFKGLVFGDYGICYDNDNANQIEWQKYASGVATAYNNKMLSGMLFKNLRTAEKPQNADCIGPVWIYDVYNSLTTAAFVSLEVDPSLAGSEYFPFNAQAGSAEAQDSILKFNVLKPCKVSILSLKSGSAFAGFTEESETTYFKAFQTISSTRGTIRDADGNDEFIDYWDVPVAMYWDMSLDNPNQLNWDDFYDKYFNGKTEKSSVELLEYFKSKGFYKEDGINSTNSGTVISYNYAYTKVFTAPAEVVIPNDTSGVKMDAYRPIMVVISPYEEIADVIAE